MRPEDRLLLLCLCQNFTAKHAQAVSDLAINMTMDWDRIARTAEQHGISSLIFRNLTICHVEGLDIPERAVQKFKLSIYKNAVVKERQTERLIRALSFFHGQDLEVMLIKGAALDLCVYKNSDYVLSDDIDIIIRARQEDYSQEYFRTIVVFLNKQGIEFEFFSHHDLDINGLLPIDFESIWEHAEHAEYHGYPVLLMSTTDLLISLCINSSRKRYFRLKSLCDISETILTKQDISWQQVAERARIFQCENIIFTALLVTSLTTECNLPKNWEEYFDIQPVRQKLIKETVNYLIKRISFYPYPFSGISILGRPMHLSLILPYIGYTGTQVMKKLSYAVRVQNK
jgi:hypothetical protein